MNNVNNLTFRWKYFQKFFLISFHVMSSNNNNRNNNIVFRKTLVVYATSCM